MAKLTRCILCGCVLRDGRHFEDGSEHICEVTPPTDRRPSVPPPPDTDPELPSEADDAERRREAEGEYLGELDEAREDVEP